MQVSAPQFFVLKKPHLTSSLAIIMPDDVAQEKVKALQSLGAEVERVRPASIVDKKQFVVCPLSLSNLRRCLTTCNTGVEPRKRACSTLRTYCQPTRLSHPLLIVCARNDHCIRSGHT